MNDWLRGTLGIVALFAMVFGVVIGLSAMDDKESQAPRPAAVSHEHCLTQADLDKAVDAATAPLVRQLADANDELSYWRNDILPNPYAMNWPEGEGL